MFSLIIRFATTEFTGTQISNTTTLMGCNDAVLST